MRLPLFASIDKGTLGFLMVATAVVAAMIFAQLYSDEIKASRRKAEADEHDAEMREYARSHKASELYDFQADRDDYYGWHRDDVA